MVYWRTSHSCLFGNSWCIVVSLHFIIVSITALFCSCWFLNWSHVTSACCCCINKTCLLYMILMSFCCCICICAQLMHYTLDSFWEAIYPNDKRWIFLKKKRSSVLNCGVQCSVFRLLYSGFRHIFFTIIHYPWTYLIGVSNENNVLKCLKLNCSKHSRFYGLWTFLLLFIFFSFINIDLIQIDASIYLIFIVLSIIYISFSTAIIDRQNSGFNISCSTPPSDCSNFFAFILFELILI